MENAIDAIKTMFDHPGRKLKLLAKVLFWLGVVVSLFLPFGMDFDEDIALVAGLFSILVGVCFSYINSLFLSAFADIAIHCETADK